MTPMERKLLRQVAVLVRYIAKRDYRLANTEELKALRKTINEFDAEEFKRKHPKRGE